MFHPNRRPSCSAPSVPPARRRTSETPRDTFRPALARASLMRYLEPFLYFVRKPGGVKNLLLASLAPLSALFVPVIGQLTLFGYRAEVGDDLDADPELADYRDLDLGN